jgi:hypothetical protein
VGQREVTAGEKIMSKAVAARRRPARPLQRSLG